MQRRIVSPDQRYLIVMRHGEQTADGLTERGAQQVRNAAQILDRYNLAPEYMVRSVAERAQKTAQTLTEHFGQMSGHTENLEMAHITGRFDPERFLNELPRTTRIILLSGHDETIQCFGHHLLDDFDTARLFQMIPDCLQTDRLKHFTAQHANALIFSATEGARDWKLWGWMNDRDIELAENYNALPPELLAGKKFDMTKEVEGFEGREIMFQTPHL